MSAKDAILKREAAKKPKSVKGRESKAAQPVIDVPVEEPPAAPPNEVVE